MELQLRLEDALNDFAVIRTTFETQEMYPGDLDLRSELMNFITAARTNLVYRLSGYRHSLRSFSTGNPGIDLGELQIQVLQLVHRGLPRRTLDRMMAVDVFDQIRRSTVLLSGEDLGPLFRYELQPQHSMDTLQILPPLDFAARVFEDLVDAVTDERHYSSRHSFDANVFQKFMALMYCVFATTDPVYYRLGEDE